VRTRNGPDTSREGARVLARLTMGRKRHPDHPVISPRYGIAVQSGALLAATWRILVVMKPARAPNRRYLPGSPFNTPPVVRPVKEFALSDQVTHDRYGLGRVIEVDERTVLVDFGDRTERINEPYPKLTRL